jgi:4-coumarate--CoA ligase
MFRAAQSPLLPRRDVLLGVLPYYHIFGMRHHCHITSVFADARKGVVMLLFYPLFCGFPVAIMPKFDPEQFCQAIERYRVTAGYVVPPILLLLAHHPGEPRPLSTSSLN